MTYCLICNSVIKDNISISELLSLKSYFKISLCKKCQCKKDILRVIHEKYIIQKDFLMKHCFATIYKPIIDYINPKLILTYPYSDNSLFDETAEIIKSMGYSCYSLKKTKIENNKIYVDDIIDLSTTLIVIYDIINADDYDLLNRFKQIKFLFITSGEVKEFI